MSDSTEWTPSPGVLRTLKIAQPRTTASRRSWATLDRLTEEFDDPLCQDTGGPCAYTGLNVRQAHTSIRVTSGELNAFMEDPIATLNDFNVGNTEQYELLNGRAVRAEIVEVVRPRPQLRRRPRSHQHRRYELRHPSRSVDQSEAWRSAPDMAGRRCCQIALKEGS
jgi:hypothetical protein